MTITNDPLSLLSALPDDHATSWVAVATTASTTLPAMIGGLLAACPAQYTAALIGAQSAALDIDPTHHLPLTIFKIRNMVQPVGWEWEPAREVSRFCGLLEFIASDKLKGGTAWRAMQR